MKGKGDYMNVRFLVKCTLTDKATGEQRAYYIGKGTRSKWENEAHIHFFDVHEFKRVGNAVRLKNDLFRDDYNISDSWEHDYKAVRVSWRLTEYGEYILNISE